MNAVPFTIHEANGFVVCSGLGDPDTLEARLGPGQRYVSFIAPDNTYIQDGEAVCLPPCPSPWHVFDYDLKLWVDTKKEADFWREVRNKRSALLAQTDWTQLPDAPTEATAWTVYRQALRDVTKQPDPENIIWPLPPKV
jgi:hypothetical protein